MKTVGIRGTAGIGRMEVKYNKFIEAKRKNPLLMPMDLVKEDLWVRGNVAWLVSNLQRKLLLRSNVGSIIK